MDKCVICDIQTLKYKCPKCLARYCSVSCCKAHKEKCDEAPATSPIAAQREVVKEKSCVPNYPLWSADMETSGFPKDYEGDDAVPMLQLESLRENMKIKELLCNQHLRAICENLVNSENPSLDMAKTMQEPIFVELADECLRVVDKNNPHLEHEQALMDIL